MRGAVAFALHPNEPKIAARCAIRNITFVDERAAQPFASEPVRDRRANEPAADHDGIEMLHRMLPNTRWMIIEPRGPPRSTRLQERPAGRPRGRGRRLYAPTTL